MGSDLCLTQLICEISQDVDYKQIYLSYRSDLLTFARETLPARASLVKDGSG